MNPDEFDEFGIRRPTGRPFFGPGSLDPGPYAPYRHFTDPRPKSTRKGAPQEEQLQARDNGGKSGYFYSDPNTGERKYVAPRFSSNLGPWAERRADSGDFGAITQIALALDALGRAPVRSFVNGATLGGSDQLAGRVEAMRAGHGFLSPEAQQFVRDQRMMTEGEPYHGVADFAGATLPLALLPGMGVGSTLGRSALQGAKSWGLFGALANGISDFDTEDPVQNVYNVVGGGVGGGLLGAGAGSGQHLLARGIEGGLNRLIRWAEPRSTRGKVGIDVEPAGPLPDWRQLPGNRDTRRATAEARFMSRDRTPPSPAPDARFASDAPYYYTRDMSRGTYGEPPSAATPHMSFSEMDALRQRLLGRGF